ncbi:MAG: TasA family protein [Patescibacteria group bacterium]
MKKVLLSLAVIAFVAAVAIGATTAYFSDTETSTGNTFTAGAIDLKVDYEGYFNKRVDGDPNAGQWRLTDLTNEKFFNFADLKPGDYGEGTISLHVYDNNAWGCMTVTPVKNDDMSSTEPELAEPGETQEDPSNLNDGELAQALTGTIWADVCTPEINDEYPNARPGDNIYQPDCDNLIGTGIAPTRTVTLPLADANGNVFTGAGPLIGSNNYYLGVSWSLPWTTGNIVQSDSYVSDISFYTEQARNNDRFLCSPQSQPE